MQVGDLVRFRYFGQVGMITDVRGRYINKRDRAGAIRRTLIKSFTVTTTDGKAIKCSGTTMEAEWEVINESR